MTIANHKVKLDKCYLKDAKRFRELVDVKVLRLSVRASREMLAKLFQKGTDVYFVVVNGVDAGFLLTLKPFDSPDWNMVYLSNSLLDKAMFAREVSRQLFRMDSKLYRIDVYYSKGRIPLKGEFFGWALAPSMLAGSLECLTYFSPELDDRQVTFLPWSFGYIAIITNPQRNKVQSIKFVRGRMNEYDSLVWKSAHLYGIVDDEGIVIPNLTKGKTDSEADILVKAREELSEYLKHVHVPEVEYEFPHGTPFQQRVWREVEKIPYGSVKTYSDLALLVEPVQEKAKLLARAVGQALSANPLPILIPCHRVIGANRELVGFSGGVDIKEHLLNMELWKAGITD